MSEIEGEQHKEILDIFMDVQRGLPRQGPGNDESTRLALSYCKDLPLEPRVLDIGCGPGQQTLVLANRLNGHITAVDFYQQFLDELRERVNSAGLSDRITIIQADMNDLPFVGQSFDLIWSEGAAYIMGVENALKGWKPLLNPTGYLVFSELVWRGDKPPSEVAAFFRTEYPAMGDVETNINLIKACGYELVHHFTLPDKAWWDDYYTPLEANIPELLERYKNHPTALEIIQTTQTEINMHRNYAAHYGYQFFISRSTF